MVTRSKRAPSTPKAMPITEGRARPLLICEGSRVEEGVVGVAVGIILDGDCMGEKNGSAGGKLVGRVVGTMFVVVTVTEFSDIVSLSTTFMSFETAKDAVESTIVKLRELADSISTRVVLP